MVGAEVRYRASYAATCCEVGKQQSAYNASVRGKYQIVFSNRSSETAGGLPLGFWSRFKALTVGMAFLIVAVGTVACGLIFGSILAAILYVCLVVAIAIVILKSTLRGVKPG